MRLGDSVRSKADHDYISITRKMIGTVRYMSMDGQVEVSYENLGRKFTFLADELEVWHEEEGQVEGIKTRNSGEAWDAATGLGSIRKKLALDFASDVNGVSQSILSPQNCFEAGFDAGVRALMDEIRKVNDTLVDKE